MSLNLPDLILTYDTFGDHRRGAPPVPIPNTAVKPSAADGSRTSCPARVGYCQITAPISDKEMGAFFCAILEAPFRNPDWTAQGDIYSILFEWLAPSL